MRRVSSFVFRVVVGVVVTAMSLEASAQDGVYAVILVDTSSSMLYDLMGSDPAANNTYGDGSERYPGVDMDHDGLTDDSRLFIAKDVITEVVSGAGTIRFGLARYHADEFPSYGLPGGGADGIACDSEDDCDIYMPAAYYCHSTRRRCTPGNFGTVCPFYNGNRDPDAGRVECPVGTVYPAVDYISVDGWYLRDSYGQCCRDQVLQWVPRPYNMWMPFCAACTGAECECYDFDTNGVCDHRDFLGNVREVGRGADLLVGYERGVAYDPNDILEWVDGVETWVGDVPVNPELRATGFTPLARSMMDLLEHFEVDVGGSGGVPGTGVPGVPPCYRYAIVLTDGDDTCEGSVARDRVIAAAGLLRAAGVTTYIIAFAITDATSLGTLDAAAAAAGTGTARRARDRDELRAAFGEIISSAVRVETCNDIDDNCNGTIDDEVYRSCTCGVAVGQRVCTRGRWGACSAGEPVPEVCDGRDNNCNLRIDEDLGGAPCGTSAGTCTAGVEACRDGVMTCVGAVGPEEEVCDGEDNDCDGRTDENDPVVDAGTRCGIDVGECSPGRFACSGGRLTCSGGEPAAEACDGLDNDCDGLTDEDLTRSCDYNAHCPGFERCVARRWTGCTARTPTGELCNNTDDDCDGSIDEDLSRPCENECGVGTQTCAAGAWGSCSAPPPRAEVCDRLDNDCDGSIDEDVTRICENDCGEGVETCELGRWVDCTAPLPELEVCDGIDNDCDGDLDESDPRLGEDCGTDLGECVHGHLACEDGDLVCDGEVPRTDEICDGHDNDCDGETDEWLPIGEPCDDDTGLGDTGQCDFGFFHCEDGDLVCQGFVGPTDEVCDCIDNDCDGPADEGLDGEPCGTDTGECEAGIIACTECRMTCIGSVGPTLEMCDCRDNDCDGETDEEDDGALCPEGSDCVHCQCAFPCSGSEFPCPTGRVCEDGYCISDLCNEVACEACQVCDSSTGQCVDRCVGRTCDDGLVCHCGECVPDICYYLGCEDDQVCLDGECVEHPCHDVECDAGQFCRDGACFDVCTAGVVCPPGQRCIDGECRDDPCSWRTCPDGTTCNPADGECTDECQDVVCPPGQVCDPATEACIDDPCASVACPDGTRCDRGTCVEPEPVRPETRVLATGGGGCGCDAAGAMRRASSRLQPVLFILGILGLLGLRRWGGAR
jgi:hypothetical protein